MSVKLSDYICSMETINVIVKGFTDLNYNGGYVNYRADDFVEPLDRKALREAIGQSLLNQDYNSVNYRYNEDYKPPKFQYMDIKINEGLLYGCIRYYEHQASDTEDYFTSKIHFSLVSLQQITIERLLKKTGQKAPFGYNGPNFIY